MKRTAFLLSIYNRLFCPSADLVLQRGLTPEKPAQDVKIRTVAHLGHIHTTVDMNRFTSDIGRRIAAQKTYRRGDFLGGSEAT